MISYLFDRNINKAEVIILSTVMWLWMQKKYKSSILVFFIGIFIEALIENKLGI